MKTKQRPIARQKSGTCAAALTFLLAFTGCGLIESAPYGETHLLSDPGLVFLERTQMGGFRSRLRRQLNKGENLNMVLMGDSIGASTFAGTVRGQNLRVRDGLKVLRAITLQYFVPNTSEDFIERLAEITGYRKYNAFTGNQSWSHRRKIEDDLNVEVAEHTYAIPGSRTDHLAVQVERFRRDFLYSPLVPEYVVISIGGNDFCDSLGAEKAGELLYGAIRQIREVSPQALVLVSGIPDVVSVHSDYDRTAFHLGPLRFSCRQRSEIFPMCARAMQILQADEEEIAALNADLESYRSEFRLAIRKMMSEHPEEGPVVYAELPDDVDMDEMLAADCFHPGRLGHQFIAHSTWQRVSTAFEGTRNPLVARSDQRERK